MQTEKAARTLQYPGGSRTESHRLDPLHADLCRCAAGGWAFGRFSEDLHRLLILWRKDPCTAGKVKDFTPVRLVGWMQEELRRFCRSRENQGPGWRPFTLHNFRDTAITGIQMADVSEKEASVMVGATPEVIRRHYEKLDQFAIARRNVERQLAAEQNAPILARPLRAGLDGA
jgi:hypothetical protein